MRGIELLAAAFVVAAAFAPSSAFAYIGPGAGITVLSALWGVVVAIFLAIGALLLWPIRGLFRRRRRRARLAESRASADAARASAGSVSRDASG